MNCVIWEMKSFKFVCCSWTIIASKFKDKTTRQCRRRLVKIWILDRDYSTLCILFFLLFIFIYICFIFSVGVCLQIYADGSLIWTLISRKEGGHLKKIYFYVRWKWCFLFTKKMMLSWLLLFYLSHSPSLSLILGFWA